MPLQCLLRNSAQGFFYVFYDDNQNLYSADTIPSDLAPFALTRNLRNTRCIHQRVMQFYRSTNLPSAAGPEGRPVEIVTYQDAPGLKRLLQRTLHRLVVDETVAPEDVVVLTPRSRERSDVWQFDHLGNFRLTDQWASGGADIYCTTIHSFKGLESPVIILAEIDRQAAHDLETLLYVGCSRAVNHLIVLAADDLADVMGR